jgi:serine/threonine protein kinase
LTSSSKPNWHVVSPSRFPWEQEAFDFVFAQFPVGENYLAWSNFEFIADDGTINEVDLLVATPAGIFLTEIKSQPGTLGGDAQTWKWTTPEGKVRVDDNPLLLANRKAKRLKSLIQRQTACKKPKPINFFIEPLVFCSAQGLQCHLPEEARHSVCLRDDESKKRLGIAAALLRREGAGLRKFDSNPVDGPTLRTIDQAMAQAGIRPRARRVGDFVLDSLVYESPTGIFQDWAAHHTSSETSKRLVRLYLVSWQADKEDRRIVKEAAKREIAALERLDHPNILRALVPAESEMGPGIVFDFQPEARRLDLYLQENADRLDISARFGLLSQIADAIRYAHEKRVLHRALSPQCIFVIPGRNGSPVIQIYNWQTGRRLPDGSLLGLTNLSTSLHTGQLVGDPARAYLAPESGTVDAEPGEEVDVFSLGALAYFLFSGKPPAADLPQLIEKLQASPSRALDLREVLDGISPSITELVENATRSTAHSRCTLEQFLDQLNKVEDDITTPEHQQRDPREAEKGSRLAHGFTVERRLGRGASSVAFMVTRNGERWVLKVARNPTYNERLKQEFAVLKKLNFHLIARAGEWFEFDNVCGFTIEPAGEETLSQLLKQEGPLGLEFLKRFGEELIQTVEYLDGEGIFHRDIKPDNIGIRKAGKESRRLCLFDFSLAPVSPNDLGVGTLDYIDPFLSDRKSKRYDIAAELYAVGITLHQMATGLMPVWGDGKSHTRFTEEESMTLRTESLDPSLRPAFDEFFHKALSRAYQKRFDNPREMRSRWNLIFEEPTQRALPRSTAQTGTPFAPRDPVPAMTPASRAELIRTAASTTPLAVLGLSTRLLNVLDRLSIHTVADVLTFRFNQFEKFRGVGRRTQQELFGLHSDLRQQFPSLESGSSQLGDGTPFGVPLTALDLGTIAFQTFSTKTGKPGQTEAAVLQPFLGISTHPQADPFLWPSQSDLALTASVSRQRIGQIITTARSRWLKSPALTPLRDALAEILAKAGGIMTHRELATSALAARGCFAKEDPERSQLVSAAVRAAVEAEQSDITPRFSEYRSAGGIYVAVDPSLRTYAAALGKAAERLALQDPLPAPLRVLEELRAIPWPEDTGLPHLSDTRLLTLAVAAASTADLSSRGEIYPCGLPPERALALSRNALFGEELTVAEIQRCISARFPSAAPLPDQPGLDRLLGELGFELDWDPTAADGQGAWKPRHRQTVSILSSESPPPRRATLPPLQSAAMGDPDMVAAKAAENRLKHSVETGSYLVITTSPSWVETAGTELSRRFPVSVCDVDAILLSALKREAKHFEVDWNTILTADHAQPDSTDWRNLQLLVDRVLPELDQHIRSADKTSLILHPGLLARYGRMTLLAALAADVGRPGGPRGLWILTPEAGAFPLPTINRQPIPITNAAQHLPLNRAWVETFGVSRSASPAASLS